MFKKNMFSGFPYFLFLAKMGQNFYIFEGYFGLYLCNEKSYQKSSGVKTTISIVVQLVLYCGGTFP